MSLAIRLADPAEDFAKVLHGADDFARLADRPELFPAPGSAEMAEVVRKLMAIPGFAVLLAEDDGRLAGGLGYWVGPYLMRAARLEFQEIFWWAAEDAPPRAALLLLREGLRRGRDAGATVITLHRLLTSPVGVDVAYRRLGATPIQVTYMGVH